MEWGYFNKFKTWEEFQQAMIDEFRHDWWEEANVNKSSKLCNYQTPFDMPITEVGKNCSDWNELYDEKEADELYYKY